MINVYHYKPLKFNHESLFSVFIGMDIYGVQVSGWQEVRRTTVDDWKSIMAEFGEQSAMIYSTISTLVLSAIVLDLGL